MAVDWTPHRFSGGALALDVTNTVVLRNDPARTFDRFADRTEIARFAEAASRHRAQELGSRPLLVQEVGAVAEPIIDLRERADRLFRGAVLTAELSAPDLGAMLRACSGVMSQTRAGWPVDGPGSGPLEFHAAVAWSALSLLSGERLRRVRICANCGWLFLDLSRNRSRVWCDMAVCGNRRKAARHYRRRRLERSLSDA
jgi:predicted RNA-binding Zn ribbon-like protein